MDNFTTSLHALPAELFDYILDLTFTPDPAEAVVVKTQKRIGPHHLQWVDQTITPTSMERGIDRTYKPPKFLQVSRATRKRFASKYYGSGSIFYFVDDGHVKEYIDSLPAEHASQIREIRIVQEQDDSHLPMASQKDSMKDILSLYVDYVFWDALQSEILREEDLRVSVVLLDGTVKWANVWELMDPFFGESTSEDDDGWT